MHTQQQDARLRALGASRLFCALSPDVRATLAAAMTERDYACGDAIFSQSDPGTTLFAVLTGQVRILFAAADGREHVLRSVGPGEIFGEVGMLDGKPRSAGAIAATRCRLLALERGRLLALMASHPEVALDLMTTLCERVRTASAQIEGLVFYPLSKRLACALLAMLPARPAARRPVFIDVTQSELGRLTGVTRESVNKKLRAWQEDGLVSLSPGRVTLLNCAALQDMSIAS
jgi:CRP-like cAMP-binding protein